MMHYILYALYAYLSWSTPWKILPVANYIFYRICIVRLISLCLYITKIILIFTDARLLFWIYPQYSRVCLEWMHSMSEKFKIGFTAHIERVWKMKVWRKRDNIKSNSYPAKARKIGFSRDIFLNHLVSNISPTSERYLPHFYPFCACTIANGSLTFQFHDSAKNIIATGPLDERSIHKDLITLQERNGTHIESFKLSLDSKNQ